MSVSTVIILLCSTLYMQALARNPHVSLRVAWHAVGLRTWSNPNQIRVWERDTRLFPYYRKTGLWTSPHPPPLSITRMIPLQPRRPGGSKHLSFPSTFNLAMGFRGVARRATSVEVGKGGGKDALPIDDVLPDIVAALKNSNCCVLQVKTLAGEPCPTRTLALQDYQPRVVLCSSATRTKSERARERGGVGGGGGEGGREGGRERKPESDGGEGGEEGDRWHSRSQPLPWHSPSTPQPPSLPFRNPSHSEDQVALWRLGQPH